jgi:hypothetical protein
MRMIDATWNRPIETIIGQTYVAIFAWLPNIQYLDLDGSDGNLYSRRLLRGLSYSRCYTSRVAHLRIRIHNFDDCLCLLDGRLTQLHTLIVKLDHVRFSSIIINDEVNAFEMFFLSFAVSMQIIFTVDHIKNIQKKKSSFEEIS